MQNFYFACLLFFFSFTAFAQNKTLSGTSGGVSGGMSGISTALADEWAVFNNVGALAATKDLAFNGMFAFENRFGARSLNTYHFGLVSPFSFGGVGGLTINRFGDKYYNETQVGLGYSHKISLVSVGAKVNYYQVAANDQIGITQGSRSTILVELGGLASISEKWAVGIYGYNFTQSSLKAADGENRIPVILKAGISYKPYEKLFLSLETEKDIDYAATVRAGINYQIHPYFVVRTGISTKPFNSSAGISFQPKNFSFDYALSNNNTLGWAHQLSLRYAFLKPSKNKN